MKKVMVLGAGKNQIPILTLCKSRGEYVIAVSPRGNFPGFALADKCCYIDTKDKEKILEVAKEEHISAILTDQTDVSVPSVAYVAEKLGLRGIGYETALRFTNKYLMRKACMEAGIPMPRFHKVTDLATAKERAQEIGWPVIIKPVDSSGSRGVRKCHDSDELAACFLEAKKHSASEELIIEKFIEGTEYLADGFAMDYEYRNLDLGIKEYFDIPDAFVSKMCMFSSANVVSDRVERMVLDMNERIVRALGLSFGITHAEYIYSHSDDTVYLVEIAARGGGVYLSSHLTPAACGFSTNDALVDYILYGKKTLPDKNALSKKVASWVCFSFPDGTIRKIYGKEECAGIDGVMKVCLDGITEGMNVTHCTDDTGKYGPILICADSREQSYRIIKKIKETLVVEVETQDGIRQQIW